MEIKHKGLDRFRKDLQKKCEKHGITLLLLNTPTIDYVDSKLQVSGYFDAGTLTLAVATDKPVLEWLEILIHESSHLDQHIEQCPEWEMCKYKNVNCDDLLEMWLNHIVELKPRVLKEVIRLIIEMERDCDRRAAQKIKKYKLDDIIDIDRYIMKSNAYHLSYDAVRLVRKWTKPKKSAYQIEEVVQLFPKQFQEGRYTLTAKQLRLIKKYCY